MSGILDKFQVEHGIHGTRVVARARELTGYCMSDSDIDAVVDALKDDLTACAREMKRLLDVNNRGALFQGWPTGRDVLDV